MCGRYTDTKRDKQFLVRMGIEQAEMDFVPRYNVAPTQLATIVVQGEHGLELRKARWGLVPFWAKDAKIGSSLINARSETVSTKAAFRNSFKKRRCLVLADGFYEWCKIAGAKQPYYIRLKGSQPFAFAGVWDHWKEEDTFSILTVEPNELCAQIHNRMPLIVREEDYPKWLDPKTPPGELELLLKPYSAAEMESFPVSRIVNSPAVDNPVCVKPALLPETPKTGKEVELPFALESEAGE